jgi:YidC/Oxa1 family membrane protein insertase
VTSTTWSAVERAVLYRWQLTPQAGTRPLAQSST